ncbi:ATP synthase F0 subcomplex A subunit [Alkalibaculum bacchi]|uniref:ATP synthase subunit a n=1 Tax=Alkalibaculum bacchi TaxID=645887 RepID=A0A366IAD0_9FIRM|nr:ATP synthase F0 subcomplex A subunit [Alkalibaculum bacchi]
MAEGPKIYAEILGIQITTSTINMWMVMAVIIILCVVSTRNLKTVPGKMQTISELIVTTMNNMVESTMGKKNMSFTPYMLTLIVYLAFANTVGLIGMRPPTADLNMTLALSILTFILTQFFAIKSKGIGTYLKGYIEPFPFLLPMNIMGELANPISLGFRLFGNLLGGTIIMGLLYTGLMNLIKLPLVIPIVAHAYFDIFSGLLQSFIFVMLSMVFIAMAMD